MHDVVVKKFTFAISPPDEFLLCTCFITFRVSRRRREMYYGHPRLCVCPRSHAYTIARTRA